MTKLNLQLLLKKYNLEKRLDISKVIFNNDGTIDYDGYVDLRNLSLKEIPIPFNKVNGEFYCGFNELTSLKNCPKEVNGFFDCSFNNLTSLKGCTPIINGNFYCRNNPTKFTEEDVKKVSKVNYFIYTK